MRTAIYTRISQDDERDGKGVARQEADCLALAARLDWGSGLVVYTENDTSATSGRRPVYERLMDDVRAGRITHVVIWDADRLTRTPREAEDLIDLVEQHGLKIANVTGDEDLTTSDGRMMFRIKIVVARREIEQTRKRVMRQSDERAAEGRPHGQIGYGFQRIDGRDVAHPDEAPVVREAARRVLDGDSLRSIVRDLNERGLPSPGGKPWVTATLRQTLKRPSLAGLRQHRGQIVGTTNGDAILTEDEHLRLVALFTDPARRNSPGTGRAPKHLLSGLARCGREGCDGVMHRLVGWTPPAGSKSRPVKPGYVCSTCHKVRKQQQPVDEFITELVIGRLEMTDAADLFAQVDEEGAREARDAIAGIDARLATAADAFAEGDIDRAQLARISAKLRAEREGYEAAITAALPPAIPADAVGPRARDAWASYGIDRRRAIIDALMTIRILPGGIGRRGFDSTLIATEWRRSPE